MFLKEQLQFTIDVFVWDTMDPFDLIIVAYLTYGNSELYIRKLRMFFQFSKFTHIDTCVVRNHFNSMTETTF